jgi:ferredoxin
MSLEKDAGGTMKITVDFDLCESNALCESLAPDVFELDDEDFLQLRTEETTPENLAAVRRAVQACPRAAISLEGDE